LQERIELVGPREDALEFMRRAEIFVQPSFFEGLPLALQEAMLSGCACIGTDIPGNDEIISHGENGLLAPKGDAARLAETLDRLISDEPLRRSFQQRARASVLDKGMSAKQMIEHHVELYERALRTH
jgi:glycosyltransferase involved in cell wall biosynthesis